MVHAPLLAKLGVEIETTLVRRGYFPQGGGEVAVDAQAPALRRVALDEPGALRRTRAVVSSHGLPRHVMERAVRTLDAIAPLDVAQDFHRGPGTGMAVALAAECDRTVLGADAVGRKGVRVEDVVTPAMASLRAELDAGVGVDAHQADQLPVFMALAGGGSFTCRRLTPHARTVLGLLPEFLPVRADVEEGARARVTIAPA
jgi:RNA 3'-terminal phosphate cyclase